MNSSLPALLVRISRRKKKVAITFGSMPLTGNSNSLMAFVSPLERIFVQSSTPRRSMSIPRLQRRNSNRFVMNSPLSYPADISRPAISPDPRTQAGLGLPTPTPAITTLLCLQLQCFGDIMGTIEHEHGY